MKARVNIGSVTMPAGRYWIGDPCYAVPNDRWMEWLKAADYMEQPRYLIAEFDGRPVLGISTAYGDGEYYDRGGLGSFPVDAGLIGVVPVEVAQADVTGMHLVEFEHDFECRYDEDDAGLIVLGHIEIETDPSEPECCACGEVEFECRCYDHDEDEVDWTDEEEN
jgi:hypothetical protein